MAKCSFILFLIITVCSEDASAQPNSANEIKINALLKQMTLEEKVGQMAQVAINPSNPQPGKQRTFLYHFKDSNMRKVILGLAVSLDGFIEGPNGEYDWCFTDQDYGLSDFFKRIDTAFIGRKTYEMTLAMGDSGDGDFPKLKEYIFSTTLDKVKDGATLIKGNIKAEVEKIKKDKGKDIWLFGGAGLTTSLLNLELIDELSLAVHPIILGGGKLLFNNIEQRISLKLLDTKTYSTGLVSLTYTLGYS